METVKDVTIDKRRLCEFELCVGYTSVGTGNGFHVLMLQ